MLAAYLAAAATGATAQVAPASYGGNQTVYVGGSVSAFRLDYGNRDLGGGTVFAETNLNDRIGLMGEASWLEYNQFANTHVSTYLGGPKFTFNTRGNFEPFVKALAGGGLFNFPYNYAHGSYFVAAGGGGLDYHLARRVNMRVVDFEYQYWPQFSFGAIHPYGVSVGFEYLLFGCASCEPRHLGH